jgi:hypothetical protein
MPKKSRELSTESRVHQVEKESQVQQEQKKWEGEHSGETHDPERLLREV